MGRRGGIGGIGLILLVVGALYFGIDPSVVMQTVGGGGDPAQVQVPEGEPQPIPADDEAAAFVSVVLGDTEDTWREQFRTMGRTYRDPKLVLFSGAVQSACGFAQAAVGPFYCPADEKLYIDLAFFDELRARFGAPGDFAQAYVIAHEVGHHVQNLLGISDKIQAARQRLDESEGNALSVRLELQADCLAGVWARNADKARQILEQGDVEEGLGAASAVGDDRLQRQAGRYVTPESFTHGSSEQRVSWFRRGLQNGDMAACDTFAGSS
jgi:predicted metalloprotease